MALGVDQEPCGLDAIADRIEKLVQEAMPKPGTGFFEKLAKLPVLAEVSDWMPKTVRKGLCQEIVLKGDQVKLTDLPVLTTWPEDGGPFITMGMSHTRNKRRAPQHGALPAAGLRRPDPGLPHPAAPRWCPQPATAMARTSACPWR